MTPAFGHLGAKVSALVDDRLDPEQRDRALDHLQRCQECTTLVAQHRRQRRLAGEMRTPPVPSALEDRLLAMAAGSTNMPAEPPSSRARGRVAALVTAGLMGLSIASVGGLYLVGSPDERTAAALTQAAGALNSGPFPHAPVDHARAGTATRPAIADAVWPHDVEFITVVPTIDNLVRVDLAVDGTEVVVFEGSGTLEVAEEDVDELVQVGDVDAYRVDKVWFAQAGAEVVAVFGPREQSLEVLGSLAVSTDTPVQRVLDGWDVLTGG